MTTITTIYLKSYILDESFASYSSLFVFTFYVSIFSDYFFGSSQFREINLEMRGGGNEMMPLHLPLIFDNISHNLL